MKSLVNLVLYLICFQMVGYTQIPPRVGIPELPNTFISDVCNLAEGGFAAVSTIDYPDNSSSGLLMVFHASGNLNWAIAVQDSLFFSRFEGIEYHDENGLIYVAGDYSTPRENRLFLIAFDTTGVQQFQTQIAGNSLNFRRSHHNQDGIVITADINLPGSTDVGAFFLDYQGKLIWQTQLMAEGYDYPYTVWTGDDMGEILIASTSESQSTDDEEEITISKLDKNGNLIDAVYLEQAGQQGDPSIFVLEDSTIIVTARDDLANTGWNIGLEHDLSLRFAKSMTKTHTDYGYPTTSSAYSLVSVNGMLTYWTSEGVLQEATFFDDLVNTFFAVEYSLSERQLVLGGNTSASWYPYFVVGKGDPLTACIDIPQNLSPDSLDVTVKKFPWDTITPNFQSSSDSVFSFKFLNPDIENLCEAILHVQNPSSGQLQLYPNPTFGELSLIVPERKGLLQVNVFNLQGSLLKEVQLRAYRPTIDVTDLVPGAYILRVIDDSGKRSYAEKFIRY